MMVIPPLASSWKMLSASYTNTLFQCRAQVYLAVALKACLTVQWCTQVSLLTQIWTTVCVVCIWILLRHGKYKVWAFDHVHCLLAHLFVFIVELVFLLKKSWSVFSMIQLFTFLQYRSCKNLIGNVQPEVNDGFSKQKNVIELKLSGLV